MSANILWVGYPASYTSGRRRSPQLIILHYTAGSEGPTSSEGGAKYDKIRTDGTSTHYFTDSEGPALQEVPDGDRSHAARFHGNEIGINIEICGTRQTRAQWLDNVSQTTLRTTAALVAELIRRHKIAFKRLTTEQVRAAYYNDSSITGICDHSNITHAFPEDNGTHEDVGPEFPWDVFMQWVDQELNGAQMWYFQLTDLRIGRADGCTIEFAGTVPQWNSWRASNPSVPVKTQQDPKPYDTGIFGKDITEIGNGAPVPPVGGITEAQCREYAKDEIGKSTIQPGS